MTHRYTYTAIVLHWLIALVLVGTFAVGFYMEGLALSPIKLKLYAWHKWAGMTLLVLAVVRLAWRLTHRVPALPVTMSRASQMAAHVGHGLLYILMLAIPISGWLMTSAKGVPVVWFGIWQLPDLVSKDEALGSLLTDVHVVLNYTLLILVIGHVAAALQHHFIKRDGVLARMLPMLAKSERR